MTKIIMHGCNGAMGQVITKLVAQDSSCEIVAGVDPYDGIDNPYKVYNLLDDIDVDADVIIDFSNPKALNSLLTYGKKTHTPLVICTTGFNEEDVNTIHQASEKTAILYSRNMSLGINLLLNLVKKATEVLTNANFDIEIIEKHHNQKIDAPSGTALALADAINETLNNEYQYNFDRSTQRVKREKKEIGIHAVRGGTIVGEHAIVFAGQDEIIELKHTAYSKEVFAVGAVNAAKFLAGKKPGMYNMSDVVE
jgi:4-hydroxy-tetrahydrodipicolinate reductase